MLESMPEAMPETASPAELIRIVMVEDHALLRGALAKTLGAEPDLQVVGECASIEDALNLVASTQVDVVLLDINLGSEQGGSFPKLAKAAGYQGKILVVTAGVGEREAAWLLKNGCSGIFFKNEPLTSLVAQVRNVMRKDFKPPAPAPAPVEHSTASPPALRRPLTPREIKVLRYVCEGLANKEIAQEMNVSEHSVKSFLHQLFAKTGARSRARLVALAIEKYWDQLDAQ